jgi:hypothetical protein
MDINLPNPTVWRNTNTKPYNGVVALYSFKMLKPLLLLALSIILALSLPLPLPLPSPSDVPSMLHHLTQTHDLTWNKTPLPSGTVAKPTYIDIKLWEATKSALYKRTDGRTYTAGRFDLFGSDDESEGAFDVVKRKLLGSIKKPVKGVGSLRRDVLVERGWFKKVGTKVGGVVKGVTQKREVVEERVPKVGTGMKKVGNSRGWW